MNLQKYEKRMNIIRAMNKRIYHSPALNQQITGICCDLESPVYVALRLLN